MNQRLDHLDIRLRRLLLELRFAVKLFSDAPPRLLQIDSNEIMTVMTHIVRELETARRLVGSEIRVTRGRYKSDTSRPLGS